MVPIDCLRDAQQVSCRGSIAVSQARG